MHVYIVYVVGYVYVSVPVYAFYDGYDLHTFCGSSAAENPHRPFLEKKENTTEDVFV